MDNLLPNFGPVLRNTFLVKVSNILELTFCKKKLFVGFAIHNVLCDQTENERVILGTWTFCKLDWLDLAL